MEKIKTKPSGQMGTVAMREGDSSSASEFFICRSNLRSWLESTPPNQDARMRIRLNQLCVFRVCGEGVFQAVATGAYPRLVLKWVRLKHELAICGI